VLRGDTHGLGVIANDLLVLLVERGDMSVPSGFWSVMTMPTFIVCFPGPVAAGRPPHRATDR
jgi:hypothetical protein